MKTSVTACAFLVSCVSFITAISVVPTTRMFSTTNSGNITTRGKTFNVSSPTQSTNSTSPSLPLTVTKKRYTNNPVSHIAIMDDPYIIESPDICSGINVTYLAIIHSSTYHFERRLSIRETWANHRLFRNHVIRAVFLIGDPRNDTIQLRIKMEASKFQDIVQGKFIDSYHNLTHKAVMSIRWITEHCRQAKFIVKADDDIFVNIFKLLEFEQTRFKNAKRTIWCPILRKGSGMFRVGKWSVARNEFKGLRGFPMTACQGYFAVITPDLIQELYNSSKTMPFFWIDDIYLYGILTEDIGNVSFRSVPGLNPRNENGTITCYNNTKPVCRMFFSKAESETVLDEVWQNVLMKHYTGMAKHHAKEELLYDFPTINSTIPSYAWPLTSNVIIPKT